MKEEILIFASILMFSAAAAHGGGHEGLPEPGATPGSAMFRLERAQESISLALTFSERKKAKKKIKFAKERLSEMKKLAEENKSERAGRAAKMSLKQFNSVNNSKDELPEKEREEIERELNKTGNMAVEVLSGLREKLPEESMKGINRALANQNRQRGPENGINRVSPRNSTRGGERNRPQRNQTSRKDDNSANKSVERRGAYVATGRVIKGSSGN